MAEKRSDNFMNFGPEWLQNLSQPQEPNFTSNSFSKSRPASSTKCQLAEYRYGREEMLALFDANSAAPDYLIKHEELYVANTQLPIALQTDMENQKRYHQDRGPNAGNNSSRPQRETNFRGDNRIRPSLISGGRAKHFPHHYGPNPPAGNPDYCQFRPLKFSRGPSWWREDSFGQGQPWRSNDNNSQHPQHRSSSSGNLSWRYKDDDYEDNERKPQVRRPRKVNNDPEDPGDSPSLPEWAENDNMGNFSGSFDALGAYTESNNDNNANDNNREGDKDSQSSGDNEPLYATKGTQELSKESFPASSVDKLAKKVEETHIEKKEPSRDVVSPFANKSSTAKLDARPKVEERKPKQPESAQPDVKEPGQEAIQSNEMVPSFADPNTFNAPAESDEGSQHNGCTGVAESISSLLNWVLEEPTPDMLASGIKANYSTDQNVGVEPLYTNMDKSAMAQSSRRNVVESSYGFDSRNLLSAIERRMKLESALGASGGVEEQSFPNTLHSQQQPVDLSNIFPSELNDYSGANHLSKLLPMGAHCNPFQQVTPTMPINQPMMPLSYQQPLSAAELPWTPAPEDNSLADIAFWNEHRLEMMKRLNLQRQQELLQSRQMNMAQELSMMTPQISQETPTMNQPDPTFLNYQSYLNAQTSSYWDEVLRGPSRKPLQQTNYDVYNNYDFLRNNMQNRPDQITIEDVFRNSMQNLNMQMPNPILNPMENSLQSNPMQNNLQSNPMQNNLQSNPMQNNLQSNPMQNNLQSNPMQNNLQSNPMQANSMNNLDRSDLLQLLQQQQQQIQQAYVPPTPADVTLLAQQYVLDNAPDRSMFDIPQPQLPLPIPMPGHRTPIPPVPTHNAPSTNQPDTLMDSPELVPSKVETMEENASNFEVVKKKEKKGKKKSDPVEAEGAKKKTVVSTPATKESIGRQLVQNYYQEQLKQRQTRPEVTNKPKAARPAPWLNQPVPEAGLSSVRPQISLAQIQRLEKEKQRTKKVHTEILVQKDKESVPWVNYNQPVDDQPSLLDIQNEERKQLTQQSFTPPEPTKYIGRADAKLSKIGGIWGPPETNSSAWNFATPPTSSVPNKTSQSKSQQPSETSKKSNQNPPHPAEDDFVPSDFNSENPDELNSWAKDFLRNFEHKLDVEAFLSFIKNVESPYEVKEYIKFYLAETKETMDFYEDYIDKRLEINRRRNQVIPADDLSAPAAAINPAMNADNQESKGKNKKNKKKMSKIDSRILGFNVTAAADRFNIGDIDCIEKP